MKSRKYINREMCNRSNNLYEMQNSADCNSAASKSTSHSLKEDLTSLCLHTLLKSLDNYIMIFTF